VTGPTRTSVSPIGEKINIGGVRLKVFAVDRYSRRLSHGQSLYLAIERVVSKVLLGRFHWLGETQKQGNGWFASLIVPKKKKRGPRCDYRASLPDSGNRIASDVAR